MECNGITCLSACKHPDGGIRKLSGPVKWCNDYCCGSIRYRGAIKEPQGFGDHRGFQDSFNGDLLLVLCNRISRPVIMVFYRNLCKLLTCQGIAVHVIRCYHRVKPGKRCTYKPLPFTVSCTGKGIGTCSGLYIGHFLDSCSDHNIFHTACYCNHGLTEGKTTGGTCSLDPGRGDMVGCQPGIISDKCTDMLLLDEPSCAHVADIHRIDLFTGKLCILKCKRACFNKELPKATRPFFTKCRATNTDYGNVSHNCITIFPLCTAYRA